MAVYTYGWVRVEGPCITDKGKLYGTFVNLAPTMQVFYGAPEIQIYNKNDNPIFALTNGIVYRQVPITQFGGWSSIIDIDANWPSIQMAINNYNKQIDTTNSMDYYWNEPFVVTQSCVIFYGESTEQVYNKYAVILVDEYYNPEVLMITAKYKGSPVPVDDTFALKDIEVYAVMSDGNKVLISTGYVVEPADRIIHNVGSNVVKITYIDQSGKKFETTIIINGVKKLVGISGIYDGPVVPYSKEAERKYFVIVAEYSDGSSQTVTDYSFPFGNIVSETNGGNIDIYYKGFSTQVLVPTYEVSDSRLIAYYSGPPVEVGAKWILKYAKIKIYYKDSTGLNSYYEDLDPDSCVFSHFNIDHEGLNQITVSFNGKCGPVTTKMIVVGFKPEVVVNFITAEYTGPDIVVGKTYSLERVIVKVHYSNGQVIEITNFSVNSLVVNQVGLNEYICTYREKDQEISTTFAVRGLDRDSTTESGYEPISLQNHYPEMTMFNNRFRGPAEAQKFDHINMMMYDNVQRLYEIYKNIEANYNAVVEAITSANSVKYWTLDTVQKIDRTIDKWIKDDRFTTGKYVRSEVE